MPFVKGQPRAKGAGRKKGQVSKETLAIKAFCMELLDEPEYRDSLKKRIMSGFLPQIELFLLTKAIGKAKEEIEMTVNAPLFLMPSDYRPKDEMNEDDE